MQSRKVWDEVGGGPSAQEGFKTFAIVFGIFQVLLIILYLALAEPVDPKGVAGVGNYYGHTDVSVMLFIGFGYLMTFLRKYAYGALAFTMVATVFVYEWYILVSAFIRKESETPFHIGIHSLIEADFAAATCLISFGGVIGKISPPQLLLMAFFEVIFYQLHVYIGYQELEAVDVGGAMFIHMYGAYFGLAFSWVFLKNNPTNNSPGEDDNASTPTSDAFSMVGTTFLWVMWPTFNSVVAVSPIAQERAVVNTVLSLSACTLAAFLVSGILREGHKYNMVDIQNATLAGGVGVGASADIITSPGAAMIVGALLGVLSVVGYVKVTPFLTDKLGLHDTCGINNLHGMPSLVASIVAIIFVAVATDKEKFGGDAAWDAQFPKGDDQVMANVLAFVITLGGAIVEGALVGVVVKSVTRPLTQQFNDDEAFSVPDKEV
eukprot:GFYU01001452.1.p1 GENE.GFYU01001452.1~~GFYU01001452.1.p1  ORF type:complete len:434 (+),score=142.35 GFYU01001452.1:132-1433(+)